MLFLAIVVVFVGVILALLYLYIRLSFSISEFSNLSMLPTSRQEQLESAQQDDLMQNTEDGSADSSGATFRNIRMLYPSKENGRSWHSNWSDGNERTLISGKRDPFDDQFIARGNGSVAIDGMGIAQMQGDAPRMYVYDENKKLKWSDVEVTVYAKRISESGISSSQGIVIGARSEHQDATLETPCNGASYYGRLLFDGRAVFQKEIIHEGSYSTNKPAEDNIVQWETADGTMPRDVWIGLKFIVKISKNGNSVKLELYRDLTDGLKGGNWEKVAEYVDAGDWSQTNSKAEVEKQCGYGASRVLTEPGTSVFIRNDRITNMQYKQFSIREID